MLRHVYFLCKICYNMHVTIYIIDKRLLYYTLNNYLQGDMMKDYIIRIINVSSRINVLYLLPLYIILTIAAFFIFDFRTAVILSACGLFLIKLTDMFGNIDYELMDSNPCSLVFLSSGSFWETVLYLPYVTLAVIYWINLTKLITKSISLTIGLAIAIYIFAFTYSSICRKISSFFWEKIQ